MMNKLRDDRGETLVEVLASILIASLSVALLFGCVMAASNMDRETKRLDGEHYKYLSAAEGRTEPAVADAKVTVTNEAGTDLNEKTKKIDVEIYGGEGLYAYQQKGTWP